MAKLDLLEKKSIIGMIHTLALPGTMDYCGDMTKVIDAPLPICMPCRMQALTP